MQNMDKIISDLNGSRLPSSSTTTRTTSIKTTTASSITTSPNEERLEKCLHSQHNEYSPKSTLLPFFLHNKHQYHHQQEQKFKHSDIETPFIASNSRCHHNNHHRIHHPKRWTSSKQSQQHHHHHNHNCHPKRKRQQKLQLNKLYSDEHTTSTQKHFSKKFSFTQHCNHLSRFYMIFVIFLIYLLDKTNCDQGKWHWRSVFSIFSVFFFLLRVYLYTPFF